MSDENRDVDRQQDLRSVGSDQQARIEAGAAVFGDHRAEGFAETTAVGGGEVARLGEEVGGLGREPELARGEPRPHVLARFARDRQFQVMNCGRAVQREGVDHSLLSEVDQIWGATRLDHMPTHRCGDRLPIATRLHDRVAKPLQTASREDIREPVEPIGDRSTGVFRVAKVAQDDLAWTVVQGLEPKSLPVEVDPCLGVFVRHVVL